VGARAQEVLRTCRSYFSIQVETASTSFTHASKLLPDGGTPDRLEDATK
jgi:hypothetical protein